MTTAVVYGVDFTSAPRRGKPITVACGHLVRDRGRPVYAVDEVRELTDFAAFDHFLATPGPWLAGFDLPFSQPRTLIEHEGWPTDWPALVRFYCGRPRDELRDTFRRWCAARPAGDKFAWRAADKPAGSSPAMRWTNPPVAWMMHAGIRRMLDAGLRFPAHRHPPRAAARDRVALEAYPAFTARRGYRGSYKSDERRRQTADRRRARDTILGALVAGGVGLDVRLRIASSWARRLVADAAGDLLDAVICGLQAADAATRPRFGLPDDVDPLEGWIATVPPA